MERLPRDINNELIKTLEYSDIIQLCKTNKKWAQICKDDNMWKILMNRDFPKLRPDSGVTYRKLYEELWNNINKAINELIRIKLIANPRYANINLMKQDIFEIVRDFMLKHWRMHEYGSKDYAQFQSKIITILAGLKEDYIGEDFAQLNIDEFDETIIQPIDNLLANYEYILNEGI